MKMDQERQFISKIQTNPMDEIKYRMWLKKKDLVQCFFCYGIVHNNNARKMDVKNMTVSACRKCHEKRNKDKYGDE